MQKRIWLSFIKGCEIAELWTAFWSFLLIWWHQYLVLISALSHKGRRRKVSVKIYERDLLYRTSTQNCFGHSTNSSFIFINYFVHNQTLSIVKRSQTSMIMFPDKLHKILSDPSFKSIITWNSNGTVWKILNPKRLEEEVIPLYFRHRSLASFMRQVNGWGFQRLSHGLAGNSYYHEVSWFALLCNQTLIFASVFQLTFVMYVFTNISILVFL